MCIIPSIGKVHIQGFSEDIYIVAPRDMDPLLSVDGIDQSKDVLHMQPFLPSRTLVGWWQTVPQPTNPHEVYIRAWLDGSTARSLSRNRS